jgi:hypothetical protein
VPCTELLYVGEAEVIPVKIIGVNSKRAPGRRRSQNKPLALASDHGRYITVISERALVSVGEWPLNVTYIMAVINL